MTDNSNLFVHSDGSLWNERRRRVVRERYRYTAAYIHNTLEMRAALRAGAFSPFGSYALSFITSDGAALCFKCAREEYRNISKAIRADVSNGWKVMGVDCEANTDSECICDHCNAEIWSAKD